MIVKPFKFTDYVETTFINGVGLEKWNLTLMIVDTLLIMEKTGTFWTVWEDDSENARIVLIAGWQSAWTGVCEVVLFPTELFKERAIESVKLLKQELKKLQQQYRRIQLNCRNEPVFTNFAKYLGFVYEGTLRQFGYDKTDHLMMAIVGGLNG